MYTVNLKTLQRRQRGYRTPFVKPSPLPKAPVSAHSPPPHVNNFGRALADQVMAMLFRQRGRGR